jgi:hypothetical protein
MVVIYRRLQIRYIDISTATVLVTSPTDFFALLSKLGDIASASPSTP